MFYNARLIESDGSCPRGSAGSYITVTQYTNKKPGASCIMVDVVGSPSDPVPLYLGSSASSPFVFPLPTPSVHEFPLHLLLMIGLLAPAVIVLGKVQRDRKVRSLRN